MHEILGNHEEIHMLIMYNALFNHYINWSLDETTLWGANVELTFIHDTLLCAGIDQTLLNRLKVF